jgi:hypothetical protein
VRCPPLRLYFAHPLDKCVQCAVDTPGRAHRVSTVWHHSDPNRKATVQTCRVQAQRATALPHLQLSGDFVAHREQAGGDSISSHIQHN